MKINVKDLKHDEYKQSLFNEETIYKEFYNLQLNKQNTYLDKINKIALNFITRTERFFKTQRPATKTSAE